jgi:D-alanine-D-alanine ligase
LVVCTHQSELALVAKRKPDLVILAVKYIIQKDGTLLWLSKYFESQNINYSGSSRETLEFDSNKVLAKEKMKSANIRTAAFFTAIPNEYVQGKKLPIDYLLFLKPIDAANGNGTDKNSLVNNFTSFNKKINSLHKKYKQPILVEKYLSGREFTVAIMETSTKNTLKTAAIEIIPPEDSNNARILGAKVKKADLEELKKITNSGIKNIVTQIAVDAFFALGVTGFGRIDIKMDEENQCYFMEANLVPGMTKGSSYFPKAFEIDNNISYDQVIQQIASFGLRNKQSKSFAI